MSDTVPAIAAVVKSPEFAGLSYELKAQAAKLLANRRIELAEHRASPKQKEFQKVFFDRAEKGRPCGIFTALGANRCLGPETLIDGPFDIHRPVSSIRGQHWAYAWDGKKIVGGLAEEPFIKGYDECFRVRLSNGQWFDCTDAHLLLTASGYQPFGSMRHDWRVELTGDAGPVHIESCEPIGQQPIYDFTVPLYENYIAAGVVHHNSGKTIVCGWLCFAKYLRDRARNGDWFWCIGQNLDRSVGGQQRELWEALPRGMFGDQSWDEKLGFGQHRKVTLPTRDGGRCLVEFRSADQDPSTFEQAKLTGVWVDERLPEGIFNRLLARVVDKNGFILYSDIPEQQWHVERLEEAEPAAGVYLRRLAMHDNSGNLPDGAIEQAKSRMTADEQRMRIYGESVVMEGIIYKEFVNVIPESDGMGGKAGPGHIETPFVIPRDWPRWRAIDYGGSAPTACAWFAVSPSEEIFVYREYYERKLSVAENARRILLMSGDEQYVQNYIDPAAYNFVAGMTESVALQYEMGGITPIIGWPRVNEMGEHAMVQKVKHRLESGTIYVFANCVNMRREFKSWKYKCDRDGRPMAADAFDDTGPCHLLDCLKGFVAVNPCFTQCGTTVETGGGDVVMAGGEERPSGDGEWIKTGGRWRRLRMKDFGAAA